jgi:DNA-binding MarR family transcriptional regulator
MVAEDRSTSASELPADLRAAWARLMSLFIDRRDATFALLHQHGLTPPHGHALSLLLGGPLKMRDLAATMVCDASYITAVTDRLEVLGLAERRPSASDRRVKEVALTHKGEHVAAQVRTAFTEPPPQLATLSDADRKALVRLCARMVPEVDLHTDPLRPATRASPGGS